MPRFIVLSLLLMGPAMSLADSANWPPLETVPHVVGRPATESDINEGRAAFLIQVDGQSAGRPMQIRLPQYAKVFDEEKGELIPVVIIQAETDGETEVFGYYNFSDESYGVGLASEFELLGEN